MASLTVFSDLLEQGKQSGILPNRLQASRTWFREKASETGRLNSEVFLKQKDRFASRMMVGQMVLFSYNPKTKDTLPYYDRLPLVFPIAPSGNSFYGINMHYLPYVYRAKLMDALYTLSSDQRYSENTRLKLTFDLLNKSARFKYFKPCVKQYLNTHIQSRLIVIHPSEWDIALFLPLERFQKATKQRVFEESAKQFQR